MQQLHIRSRLLLGAAPVTITINNTPASPSQGGFWGAVSGVKAFADAHPYVVYAVIGVTIGAAAYLFGGRLFGRSLERSLGDPASTARLVQTNANLRNERERTRAALAEVRDSLADLNLKIGNVQSDTLAAIGQQTQALDAMSRETGALLLDVNTNVMAVHEMIGQVLSVMPH